MAPTTIATPTATELAAIFGSPLSSPDVTLVDRLDTICRFVRYGDLPFHFDAIAYGIQWARQTGRLSGQVEMALRGLNRRQLAALVVKCAAECASTGDVPAWLIGRLG